MSSKKATRRYRYASIWAAGSGSERMWPGSGKLRTLTGGMIDGVWHGVLLSAAHGGEGEATASQAHGGPTLQYQPGHSPQATPSEKICWWSLIFYFLFHLFTMWRDLTKVISILNYSRGPRTDMSLPGIEPGPPRWEARTLEKSHLNSMSIAIRNKYMWARDQWSWIYWFTEKH